MEQDDVRPSVPSGPFAVGELSEPLSGMVALDLLRQSEEKLRLLFQGAQDAIFWVDADSGSIIECNKAAERMVGLPRERLIGTHHGHLYPREHRGAADEGLIEAAEAGGSRGRQRVVTRSDGGQIHVEVSASLSEVCGQQIVQAIFHDVTERRSAQEELERSELRLRLALDAARAGTWEVDLTTGAIAWSDALWGLLGLERGEREPSLESWADTVAAEDRPGVVAEVRGAMAEARDFHVEWRVDTRDGPERYLMARGAPLLGDGDEVLSYLGIALDVTEDRRVRDRLKWTQRKLDEAHRIARIGVWDWVVATDTFTWSEELYRIVGRDVAKTAPNFKEHISYYTPESWITLASLVEEALETGKSYDVELEMVREDGGTCWTRTVGGVVRGPDGEVVGLHGTVHDISEKKQAELDLERYRRRLSALAADLLTSGERERRRIAVDLHDGLGQSLAAAKILLQRVASTYDESEGHDEFRRLSGLLDAAISDVRSITAELSPPVLYELGLGPAFEWLADACRERYGLRCMVNVARAYRDLKSEKAVLLFRVGRELLSNVHRHSGVDSARVSLTAREDTMVLTVEDDGVGFDFEPMGHMASPADKFGLLSIREQVAMTGGTVEIDSAQGRGTRIDVRVPAG